MQFQIMEHLGGKEFKPVIDRLNNKPLIYECPKEAARVAVQISKIRKVKCQPRPVVETAPDWKAREQKRFDDGSYKPVVWIAQDWWKHHNPDHFVHISVKDPTRIAFTRNAEDGSKDVQTSMKPGKYLTEFFSKVLSPEEIRDFAMQHANTFENKTLKFATTPEEIERVYKSKIGGSCFSGTKKANLYGSGDFAVAYIETDGVIKARAVCAPERKAYVHPYGDVCRLRSLLEEAGYEDAGYDDSKFVGLRLLKEHYWYGFYTDFGGEVVPHPTEPEKYYVIA